LSLLILDGTIDDIGAGRSMGRSLMTRRKAWAVCAAVLIAALASAACSAAPSAQDEAPATVPTTASPTERATTSPPVRTGSEPWAALAGLDPSLADRFDVIPQASAIERGRVRERTASYTSYDIAYASDGLRISGVLNVPDGRGPFPAVVLAHGYIDPALYVRGQGMTRERGFLAERGFVALHVDYRNHADSDDDAEALRQLDRGYATDVLGAVAAIRASDLPVDPDRISLFGRSMGGGVVLQALEIAPGFVAAGVAYSGVSSLEADNYNQFGRDGDGFAADFIAERGTPEEAPQAWLAMSTRPYVDRITEPVLMIHGRRDDTCPPSWASATEQALAGADVDVELRWYDDGHAFGPRFTDSMEDLVAFLEART
jgi:dipeptidyl aminopeptidase/acylaminoacyl peptidase